MTLRLTLSSPGRRLLRSPRRRREADPRAATAAVREAAELAQAGRRASIAAAGFSRKRQNALRSKVYLPGRDSMRAAAPIYHKVPYAKV